MYALNEEPLFENVLSLMLKEILDDPALDVMAERLATQPVPLFAETDDGPAPGIAHLDRQPIADPQALQRRFAQHVRELNVCEDSEYARKRLFLDDDSGHFLESIIDNTLFNILQEATHSECDLMKAPRTYISKKP